MRPRNGNVDLKYDVLCLKMFLSLEKYWLEFCISRWNCNVATLLESATTLSDNPMNLFVDHKIYCYLYTL